MEFLATFAPSVEPILEQADMLLALEPGGISWLVLHMTGRPVNVLNATVIEQVTKVLDIIETMVADNRIKLILICSAKPNTFVAGADIDQMYPNTILKTATHASASAQKVFNRIASLNTITVACINGPALGAGLELALACHYRFCSDNPKTQLGLPEVKLGLLPGAGGTVRLPRLVGLQAALGLILSGSSVRPEKALQIGLVDGIVPCGPASFYEPAFLLGTRKLAVERLHQGRALLHHPSRQDRFFGGSSIGRWFVAKKASESLDKMTRGRYPAPYLALDSCVYGLGATSLQAAFDHEASLFGKLAISPESKALMAAFYMMESSKKLPMSIKSQTEQVKKFGVIGAGIMGAQIAAIVLNKGFAVFLRDISAEAIQSGLKHVSASLDALVDKGRLQADVRDAKLKMLSSSTSLDGFRDCDIVIEAVVERMDLKQKILQEVERVLPSHAIFTTNTSSLSVSTLSKCSNRPNQVCGMHFFNPVQKMPLVEVIRGTRTDNRSLSTVYKLALQLGKIPCICNDAPGFIVNRILGIYMNEAGLLAMEGSDITTIDQALVEFGMPMGPFRLMDEVGLDVAAHVGPILEQGLGVRFKQNAHFAKILAGNPKRLGKKTGAGFFLYDKSGNTTGPNRKILEEICNARGPSPGSEPLIIDRCILISIQEACYILAENICESSSVLDLAVIFGTGFPPFRGGLLNHADQVGISNVVSRLKKLAIEHGQRFCPHPMLEKMANDSTLFFPSRPQGMTPIGHLPRSSCQRQSKL